MAKANKSSWWITLGCGCLVLVVLGIATLAGGGWFAASKLRNYAEDLENPERRDARARELLGADALPAGYQAVFYFEVPWVLHFVALSDDEPGGDLESDLRSLEELSEGQHHFFYIRYRFEPDDPGPMGGSGGTAASRDGSGLDVSVHLDDLDLKSDTVFDEGTLDLEGQTVRYGLHRGSIDGVHDRQPGVYSSLSIDCPGEPRQRFAVWFERRALPEAGVEEDLAGSPADATALSSFLEHFDLCAR